MKKLLPMLFLFLASCSHKGNIDKGKFSQLIQNYYLLHAQDVKEIDYLNIDSIVAVTEKKQVENNIRQSENKYYYFIEAKDDEYADSTAKVIAKLQEELITAENTQPLYYSVYHTIQFVGSDNIPRRRQSDLDITLDYKLRPNETTEKDKTEGIQANKIYKPYSY